MTFRNAYLLLGFFFLVITVLDSHARTVFDCYQQAAMHWQQQQNLYDFTGGGFVYLPQSAILQIPFTYFHSFALASIVWRALWMVLIAYAIFKWCHTFGKKSVSEPLFFFVIAITLIFGISDLRNGQLNVALLVFGLLSLVTIYEEKWWLAAFYLTLGLMFKTLFLTLPVICFILYPRLRMKLLMLSVLAFLLPFIAKDPHYVISQYALLIKQYHVLGQKDIATSEHWAQFFGMLGNFGYHVGALMTSILRAVFAVLMIVGCMVIKRDHQLQTGVKIILIYSVVIAYILLFGPRTEGNTYVIFAPVLAFFWYAMLFMDRHIFRAVMAGFIFLAFVFSYYLTRVIIPSTVSDWISPFLSSVVMIMLVHYYLVGNRFICKELL